MTSFHRIQVSVSFTSSDTHHFLNLLIMDSGEMASQAVLQIFFSKCPFGVGGNFPGNNHSPYRCLGQPSNGLLYQEPVTERPCLLVLINRLCLN
jgi:hypothetical protein